MNETNNDPHDFETWLAEKEMAHAYEILKQQESAMTLIRTRIIDLMPIIATLFAALLGIAMSHIHTNSQKTLADPIFWMCFSLSFIHGAALICGCIGINTDHNFDLGTISCSTLAKLGEKNRNKKTINQYLAKIYDETNKRNYAIIIKNKRWLRYVINLIAASIIIGFGEVFAFFLFHAS